MTDGIAQRALFSLAASGALRSVDRAFADLLRTRLGADAEVALAGALAMRAVSLGHSGFALAQADDVLAALDAQATLPSVEDWAAALRRAAPLVADNAGAAASAAHAALLCFEHGRVALSRYAAYEQMLAARLCAMAAGRDDNRDEDTIATAEHDHVIAMRLGKLFGESEPDAAGGSDALNRQALTAAQALRRRLLLITGGPGTGKTTTVARLLIMLIEDARQRGAPSPRITLAAPTGRAAVRLAEAIDHVLREDVARQSIDAALADVVPRQAYTLHRLLGTRPGSTAFRHDASRRLPFDVVVVDEASMVDLPLMAKLVAAVRDDARLILLGDPDQLPAIEAGDVLGSLCEASGDGLSLPHADARAVSRWLGAQAPEAEKAQNDLPLSGCRVHLLRDWRQADAAALQAVSMAVREGDSRSFFRMLQTADAGTTLSWRNGNVDILAVMMRDEVLPAFAAVRDAPDVHTALKRARMLRILTALRRGPFGAERWNAWCAAELGGREAYFHGRLLMIVTNSERHGLYNGDIGVVWHAGEAAAADRGPQAPKVWFAGPDGLRGWRPEQLPAHVSAYATTVHKAQGSEFERVALILPDHDTRNLSRELLYTALTRARRRMLLWGDEAVLGAALSRRTWRDSGLLARLQAVACPGEGPATMARPIKDSPQ